MNAGIFFEWLKSFDSYLGETGNRKALMLVDNASCHGTLENLLNFLSIELIFSPPKTISKLHPIDFGVINALKSHYRHKQRSAALNFSRKIQNQFMVLTSLRLLNGLKKFGET